MFAVFDEHAGPLVGSPAAGVIVYRLPAANLAVRNRVTAGYFAGLPQAVGLGLLNQHVRCISRLIIDPRYRGIGLASRLVRETMPLTEAAMIEATSVRAQAQTFFERAGMRRYPRVSDMKTDRIKAALETVGIGENLRVDTEKAHNHLSALPAPQTTGLGSHL